MRRAPRPRPGAEPRSPCARRTPSTAAQSAPWRFEAETSRFANARWQPRGRGRRIRQGAVEPDRRLSAALDLDLGGLGRRSGCALDDPLLRRARPRRGRTLGRGRLRSGGLGAGRRRERALLGAGAAAAASAVGSAASAAAVDGAASAAGSAEAAAAGAASGQGLGRCSLGGGRLGRGRLGGSSLGRCGVGGSGLEGSALGVRCRAGVGRAGQRGRGLECGGVLVHQPHHLVAGARGERGSGEEQGRERALRARSASPAGDVPGEERCGGRTLDRHLLRELLVLPRVRLAAEDRRRHGQEAKRQENGFQKDSLPLRHRPSSSVSSGRRGFPSRRLMISDRAANGSRLNPSYRQHL